MQNFNELWEQAWKIWLSGGWAMIAIAFIAFVIFVIGMHIYFKLRRKGFKSVSEKKWRRWITHPDQREGHIGELIDFVTVGDSVEDTMALFEELRATEIAPIKRDLSTMKICVGAAPLMGLLGTVTGMLATFWALSTGLGGDKTMGLVAEGISEALVTTETGLVIAIPGLFFQYVLSRNFDRYKVFLSHLETVCIQMTRKKSKTLPRRLAAPQRKPLREKVLQPSGK